VSETPAVSVDREAAIAGLYRAQAAPALVTVPELAFVVIDGHGDPNTSPAYAEALQALFRLAYGLKSALRRQLGVESRVGPPEGLWWAADPAAWSAATKSAWDWTMMIRVHDAVTSGLFEAARGDALRKGPAAVTDVRLERLCEGACAQVLHVGPYAAEAPTIAMLHTFIADSGLRPRDRHHEIYLGDPRRTPPERLRTIIRQPVASVT
jgi:hypothetical protein